MDFSWLARGRSNDDLISQLKKYQIIDSPEVESAMAKTDRGLYSRDMDEAYVDAPHSIGYGATISAPHMHAKALEVLKDNLKPKSEGESVKVLDVGSGSGYLSACFARMLPKNGKVVGIDVIPELVNWAFENIKKDDPELLSSGKIDIRVGDGWEGDTKNAPFDAIHVGAAAETLPQKLVQQLKPGGRMVIPVGKHDQWLLLVDKDKEGKVSQQKLFGVRYVPLVKKQS